MAKDVVSAAPDRPLRQRCRASLRLGKHVGMETEVELTPRGILAIAGLVSSILLSTAVLVAVAVREGRD
jgi:hypothetical protein